MGNIVGMIDQTLDQAEQAAEQSLQGNSNESPVSHQNPLDSARRRENEKEASPDSNPYKYYLNG